MKFSIQYLILFLLLISCDSTNKVNKSNKFAIGEYRYLESPFDKIYVQRDGFYQTEFDSVNKILYKLKINWVNNNEYVLTLVSSSDSLQNLNVGHKLHVKIIRKYKNHYRCRSEFNGNTLDLTMIKINSTSTPKYHY